MQNNNNNQLSILYDNKLLECLNKLESLDSHHYDINDFMKELGTLYQEHFQYHIASIVNNAQQYEPYIILILKHSELFNEYHWRTESLLTTSFVSNEWGIASNKRTRIQAFNEMLAPLLDGYRIDTDDIDELMWHKTDDFVASPSTMPQHHWWWHKYHDTNNPSPEKKIFINNYNAQMLFVLEKLALFYQLPDHNEKVALIDDFMDTLSTLYVQFYAKHLWMAFSPIDQHAHLFTPELITFLNNHYVDKVYTLIEHNFDDHNWSECCWQHWRTISWQRTAIQAFNEMVGPALYSACSYDIRLYTVGIDTALMQYHNYMQYIQKWNPPIRGVPYYHWWWYKN